MNIKQKVEKIIGHNDVACLTGNVCYCTCEEKVNKIDLLYRKEIEKEIEGMMKKTFNYVAKPTISADLTAFGGKKITAGKSYRVKSSLSEEEITYNQALQDVIDLISHKKETKDSISKIQESLRRKRQ